MKRVLFALLLALLLGVSIISLNTKHPRRGTIICSRNDGSESCCANYGLRL